MFRTPHRVLAVLLLSAVPVLGQHNEVRADRVVVLKKDHVLTLYRNGRVLKQYRVALGWDPVGPKERQGDHKTPEGDYIIDRHKANSQYHLALHISYPNEEQVEVARKAGYSPGGDVFIHGLPAGYGRVGAAHRRFDWTDGCIAVTNQEIEEIWRLVPVGTPVEIRP